MVLFLLCFNLLLGWRSRRWRRRSDFELLELSLLAVHWLWEVLGCLSHIRDNVRKEFLSISLTQVSKQSHFICQWKKSLTREGRLIRKVFFFENPNKSRTSSGFTLSGGLSVMPRTNTGSVGGIARSSPRKVVSTASLIVWYHVSIAGRYMTLGLWRLTSANNCTIAVSAD